MFNIMHERCFVWYAKNDNGEWIDSLFMDRSPNSERRDWRLCQNVRTGEIYAQLLRADANEEEFNHSVILPRKFIAILQSSLQGDP